MIKRYGRYEVLYKLGQGAMAEVYLARDPVLARSVAIKVLHADLATRKDVLQRFLNEARAVAIVRNPHVVEVFDFGQQDKDLYLVMEFVEGLSLQSILSQLRIPNAFPTEGSFAPHRHGREQPQHFKPMDPDLAAALICQAAEGLVVAAQNGIVHRDIKPENLLINQQGYLKISDFGIAHLQDDSLTQTGAVLGSPLFMSPEQSRGLKPITSQADLFSLGAVFYTCLAGHPPFKGRSITELFKKIATEPHPSLITIRPDLDPNLVKLIDTLLEKNPQGRGGGPLWLEKQLKRYLQLKGIFDPMERVKDYMDQLSARGIQTTWQSDIPGQTLASTQPAQGFSHEVNSTGPRFRLRMALICLGLIGIGAWVGFSLMTKDGQHLISKVKTEAIANQKSDLENDPIEAQALAQRLAHGLAQSQRSNQLANEPVSRITLDSPPLTQENLSHSVQLSDSGASPQDQGATEPSGVLELSSSPPFAEVFVDGRLMGITPLKTPTLQTGQYRFLIKGKNTQTLDTLLLVKPGVQAIKFKLDEKPMSRMAGSQEP